MRALPSPPTWGDPAAWVDTPPSFEPVLPWGEWILAQNSHQSSASGDGPVAGTEVAAPGGPADRPHEAAPGESHRPKYTMPAEFPNIYTLIEAARRKPGEGHHEAAGEHHAPFWVNPAFSLLYGAVFVAVVMRLLGRKSLEKPSRGQVAVEGLFEGLMKFFGEIVGPDNARKYVPYVGALWLFILVNNLSGLVPLLKSPTGHFQVTIGLGICTFFYVNYQGIRAGGLGHYVWHLCGSPRDWIGWVMAVLLLPLEIISTLVKPLSLSLRLFGNIFGEDKLLAAFLGLGMLLMGFLFRTSMPVVGLPLHLPFMFLATLTSVIQATVFAMLAAVYIAMLLPHEEHEHGEEGHGEAAHSTVV